MGPDRGVQQVLRTGVMSAGSLGFATGLWTRDGKFYAEARAFVRGPLSQPQGLIDTIRVGAVDGDVAAVLLEKKVLEKYGPHKQIRWWKTLANDERARVGQRVWILDPADGTKQSGVIVSLSSGGFLMDLGGFVALLDGHRAVVTCSLDRRGTHWDFAD